MSIAPPRGNTSSRLSSESTSTVNTETSNVDLARRRLREFYKIQDRTPTPDNSIVIGSASPTNTATTTESDSDDDLTSEHGVDFEQTDLDNGMDVDDYVKKLLDESDMKQLIRHDKALVQQLGALNSKKKSLVYNNYNKLISASGTLQSIKTNYQDEDEEEDKRLDLDGLKESMAQIADIAKTVEAGDAAGPELQDKLQAKQAAQWILGVEKHMSELKNQNRRAEAIEHGNKAVKLVDTWIEQSEDGDHGIKELSIIRERCAGMLSVL